MKEASAKKAKSTSNSKQRSPEYIVWVAMKRRTLNPKSPYYYRYGGRGIKCCERWLNSFENFLHDMGVKPYASATLERLDNNGDYNPSNCVWASKKEQARNRSSNRIIEHKGESKTLSAWAEQYGLDPRLVWIRLKHGWTMHDALTKPIRKLNKNDRFRIIEYLGESKTLQDWSLLYNVNMTALRQRVNRGWSPERIFTTPIKTPPQ